MGFLKRIGKKEDEEEFSEVPRQYIDLGKKDFSDLSPPEKDTIWIKKVHFNSSRDIRRLTGIIYSGNILLLDTKSIVGDDLELRRVTAELTRAAKEKNGDLAQIEDNLILVTPGPIKIERS